MHLLSRLPTRRTAFGISATLLACAATLACSGAGTTDSADEIGQTDQAVTGTVTISGQLTDAAGMPFANITVKLNGSKQATAITDFAGNYTFTVAAGGSYSLSASGTCAKWTPEVVNLNNVTTNKVVDFAGAGGACIVAPQQGATSGSLKISGQVTSAGHPVAGATVSLTGSAQGTRISDETGAYSFSVNPGSFTLNIAGACSSFTQNLIHLNNITSSRTQNFTGNTCPPAPLTFCPALDAAFLGENGGAACTAITTPACPDRLDTWDFEIVIDYAVAVTSDCRFGNLGLTTSDQVASYLNDLLAFTLELFGCPAQGLQSGPLTDRLIPSVLASHTFTTADLQGLSDVYVAAFSQAFADFGLPAPTAAQVSALRAQLTYLQSKVPNKTTGTTFSLSTCSP
jgi:hypothetical protein